MTGLLVQDDSLRLLSQILHSACGSDQDDMIVILSVFLSFCVAFCHSERQRRICLFIYQLKVIQIKHASEITCILGIVCYSYHLVAGH